MTFWEHFLRLLPKRPVPALAALYWHVTRRRVRARNLLRAASFDLPFTYLVWIQSMEQDSAAHEDFPAEMQQWQRRPKFSIILHGSGEHSEEDLARSLRSIEQQIYPDFERVEESGTALAKPVNAANGEFILPLRIGDRLSQTALFRFAEALQSGEARVLYGDEDELDRHGTRSRPWFKPRWNEELFFAQDYLSSAVAIETALAKEVFAEDPGGDIDDLLLAATSRAREAIVHVPYVLCHIGSRAQRHRGSRLGAVDRHLEVRGARTSAGPFDTIKVEWPLPDQLPLVSIVVPTKDKLSLLRPCIDGLLKATEYPNFEVLIVDNGSIEKTTVEYLAQVALDERVRVASYPHPYNYSAINNFAVGEARGSFVCLLNNDTEVVEPGWLTEMMRYAVRPDIGAVGAKLLYDDGTIQHAGVVVGIGEAAGHAHRFLPANEPGYFRMPHVAHFVTAVTAACMVVQKAKFEAVGGLDEEKLAIAFNDVDLCLKLQAAGWRNVYVPHAVLVHHESKSRGDDMSPLNVGRYRGELATLQQRWGTKTYMDPLHNPNLDRYSETFVFRL